MEILGKIHGLEENRFWVTLIKGDRKTMNLIGFGGLKDPWSTSPNIDSPEAGDPESYHQKERVDAEREAARFCILPEDDHFWCPIRLSPMPLAIELL